MAAVVVGSFDEGLTGRGEVGLGDRGGDFREDHGDVVSGELAGETVGGEQIEVSGTGTVALNFGVHVGLGADGAGDEITDRGGCRLGGRDVAGADLLFDEGMICGEEDEVFATAAVTAAIAHVGEPEIGRDGTDRDRAVGSGVGRDTALDRGVEESDEGGTHACEVGRGAAFLVDGVVGGLNGVVKASLRLLGAERVRAGRCEMTEDRMGGQVTGDFAGCGTAHTVAHEEDSSVERGGTVVLIAPADTAWVSEHREDEIFRLQG